MIRIDTYKGEINGIKYLHVKNANTSVAYLLFLVNYGSRYEQDSVSGIAHFIEHMIFKSTKKRKTSDILQEIELIGGVANAFTSYELTGFYISVLTDMFDKAFEIFSDLLQNGLFNEDEIEIEKGNIIEEIKMYKDSPQDYISLLAQENIFSNSSLGRSILGKEEIISKFNKEILLKTKDKFYNTNNLLIASGGNFDVEKLIKNIQKHLSLEKGNKSQTKAYKFNPREKIFFFERKEVEQAHVIISFEAKDYFDDEYNYKASILSTIIGEGLGSILFRLLREKLGVAYYVGSELYQYQDTGNLNIYFGCNLEQTKKVIDKIFEVLSKIKHGKLKNKDLKRAQNLNFSSISMKFENIRYVTNSYAQNFMLKGKFETINEIKEKIYKVNLIDIQDMAIKIFNDNYSINYIGPKRIF